MLSNPYERYKKNSITTATKEELTLMLYDGCLKFMTLGRIAIEEKNIEEAHNNIMRALDILRELDSTLNMEYEISKDLRRLYEFVVNQLVSANTYKKTEFIDAAKDVMTDIRDGWKEAMVVSKKDV